MSTFCSTKLSGGGRWTWSTLSRGTNTVVIAASQKCISTGSSSCRGARAPYNTVVLMFASCVWWGKKPTSRRKVVDRTPVHDVKSLVMHFTTSPPGVSGCSSLFDTSQGSAASPVLRYSLIINLLQI